MAEAVSRVQSSSAGRSTLHFRARITNIWFFRLHNTRALPLLKAEGKGSPPAEAAPPCQHLLAPEHVPVQGRSHFYNGGPVFD